MCDGYYVSRGEAMASGTLAHPSVALREGTTHKRRRIKKRCKSGKYVEDVTLEELLEHTHLPSGLAAQKLGLGITVFKKLCRKRGLARWPYQKPNQQPESPPGLPCPGLEDSDSGSQVSLHGSQSSGQTTGQAQGCLGLLLSAATEAEGSASGRSQRTSSPGAAAAAEDKAPRGSIMELAKVLSTNPALARQLADAMDTLTRGPAPAAAPLAPSAAVSAFAPELTSAFAAAAPALAPLRLPDARCGEWTALQQLCAMHSADSLRSAGSAFVPYTPFAASLQQLGAPTLPPSPCAAGRDFPSADVLPHSAWVAAYNESLHPALMPRLQPGAALHTASHLPEPPTPPQSTAQSLLVPPPLPAGFASAASAASAAPIAEGLAQLEQLQRLQQLMALQREQQRQQAAGAAREDALAALRPSLAPCSARSPWMGATAGGKTS